MNIKRLFQTGCLGVEEGFAFSELPSVVNGISDEKGRVFLVQAPALKYLTPDAPQEINFRWVYRDHKGRMVSTGATERRQVVRRGSGIIPLYYFAA